MAFSLMQPVQQESIQRPPKRARVAQPDLWQPLVCMALFAAAVALIHPVAEIGVGDDYSYNYTARVLAASGRLVYNGWATATIGPQAYWGALFIKLFGVSFTAVRLSTAVLTLLCIPVLYRLGRESGLRPVFASFAVLVCVFSPVFLPLELTFMTDVPAFWFATVCVFSSVRAWRAKSFCRYAAWAAAATIAGGLAGATRQIYWLLPLMSLPATGLASYYRRDRAGVWFTAAAWGATVVGTVALLRWFHAQPYAVIGYMGPPSGSLWSQAMVAGWTTLRILETAALLLIPVLVFYLGAARQLFSRRLWIYGCIAVVGLCLMYESQPQRWPPRLGDIVTQYEFLASAVAGRMPVILTPPVRVGIACLLFVATASFLAAAAKLTKMRRTGRPARSAVGPLLALALPFGAGCILLMAARAVTGEHVYDRYLMPLLPALSIPLLWLYQERIRGRVPAAGWLALALFGGYALGSTHDFFTFARARLSAIEMMRNSGVPRTAIRGGFEYDGWTEIETTGRVNDPRISPASAYRPIHACTGGPEFAGFLAYTPSLRPRYFVLHAPIAGMRDAPFPAVPYRTWLPPHGRQVLIQVREDGGTIECR